MEVTMVVTEEVGTVEDEAMEVFIMVEEAMVMVMMEEEAMEMVMMEEEAMEVVIVEEEDMETMVVDITQKEVKVGLVTIPREVSFNGNILPCVSDMATEYRVKSIFVVLALSVLILMFMQKMVRDLREISIASWGKLHETKTFRLNQMENSFIKEACWCLSYRGVSIL